MFRAVLTSGLPGILVELNEFAQQAVAEAQEASKTKRSGKAMWKKAKLMIPFASAVKTLADIPMAVAKRIEEGEEIDSSIPTVVMGDSSCVAIQVAVPVAAQDASEAAVAPASAVQEA